MNVHLMNRVKGVQGWQGTHEKMYVLSQNLTQYAVHQNFRL